MVDEPLDPKLKASYEVIIQKVINSELLPDNQGVVQLPPDLASVTKNGQVYSRKSKQGVTMIVFSTWIGKGYNMRGYLYASKPLTTGDTYKDYYGNTSIAIGPTELVVDHNLSDHWYVVSRSLD